MSTPNPIQPLLRKAMETARDHLWLWFVPTVGLTLLASAYCLVRQPTWRARQAFLVRDESGGAEGRQGRFDSVDTMKTAQETILEVARSKSVVESSLAVLGRPASHPRQKPWPGESDIEAMQDRISVTPPQGAEFGHTEVIYLAVTGPSRDEALRQTRTVCDQLQIQLAGLRRSRAMSVISELRQTVATAENELRQSTAQLQELEQKVGPDLAELRTLNDGAREGNLQRSLTEIKAEIRRVQSEQQANLKLRELLAKAAGDPDEFLATPGRLLASQPALRRLKEGLVDAQLQTSSLLGSLTPEHPLAIAAKRAEEQVRASVHGEIASTLGGVEADLQVGDSQIEALVRQQEEQQQRYDRLASLRVHYGNLVDDRLQRTEILQRIKQSLADAEASQTAAQEASLLTRMNEPEVGNKPIGPSNKLIVMAGFGGGLATGLSLLLLAVPMSSSNGTARRWSDYVGFGRRVSDQGKRRSDDAAGRSSDQTAVREAPVDSTPVSPSPQDANECVRRSHDKLGIPKTDRRYGVRRNEDTT